MNADNFLYKEITDKLLACAFKVHNTLGCGFLEKVYENALVHELSKEGLFCEQQKILKVWYDSIVVGEYIADMVVDNKLIVEMKAVKDMNHVFEAQLLNYLKGTGLKVGYVFNFGNPRLEYKRMILSV